MHDATNELSLVERWNEHCYAMVTVNVILRDGRDDVRILSSSATPRERASRREHTLVS